MDSHGLDLFKCLYCLIKKKCHRLREQLSLKTMFYTLRGRLHLSGASFCLITNFVHFGCSEPRYMNSAITSVYAYGQTDTQTNDL